MITAADVARVGFTAKPYRVRDDVELTIDDLVRLTTAADWDGNLYELNSRAAQEIAFQFNLTHKLAESLDLPVRKRRVRSANRSATHKVSLTHTERG